MVTFGNTSSCVNFISYGLKITQKKKFFILMNEMSQMKHRPFIKSFSSSGLGSKLMTFIIIAAAGTEDCVDKARSISGGLTCRQFLERYGFQYCNYQSMRKSCCASHQEVCQTSRWVSVWFPVTQETICSLGLEMTLKLWSEWGALDEQFSIHTATSTQQQKKIKILHAISDKLHSSSF